MKQHWVVVTLEDGKPPAVLMARSLQHRVTLVVRDMKELQKGAADPLDSVPLSYLRGELGLQQHGSSRKIS